MPARTAMLTVDGVRTPRRHCSARPRLDGHIMRKVGLAFLMALIVLADNSPATARQLDDPVVEATEDPRGSVTVKLFSAAGRAISASDDPLRGCAILGPFTGAEVRELMKVLVGARVAKLIDDEEYAVLKCDRIRFDGAADAVWPVSDDPPPEVIQMLARSAVARLSLPTPRAETAPDGFDTPFLVHLPVWFWINDDAWHPISATASLGPEYGSATARATPQHSEWFTGRRDRLLRCSGRGHEWTPLADDGNARCAFTYRRSTQPNTVLELRATSVFTLSIDCSPARLCEGVDLPAELRVTVTRPIRVTEARGVITH